MASNKKASHLLPLHFIVTSPSLQRRQWETKASPTCFRGNSMNSSVLDTSTKCCRTYLCADLSRSLQECVSANPRMPRQLEGSSWLRRNLQQASRTPLSCSRLAAGSNVWAESNIRSKLCLQLNWKLLCFYRKNNIFTILLVIWGLQPTCTLPSPTTISAV